MTHTEPTLFDYLESTEETLAKVVPNLLDKAHPAGDLLVQHNGHFAMGSVPDREGRCRVWTFIDLGNELGVVTCTIHGNTIDPPRARALAGALTAWADRRDRPTEGEAG